MFDLRVDASGLIAPQARKPSAAPFWTTPGITVPPRIGRLHPGDLRRAPLGVTTAELTEWSELLYDACNLRAVYPGLPRRVARMKSGTIPSRW